MWFTTAARWHSIPRAPPGPDASGWHWVSSHSTALSASPPTNGGLWPIPTSVCCLSFPPCKPQGHVAAKANFCKLCSKKSSFHQSEDWGNDQAVIRFNKQRTHFALWTISRDKAHPRGPYWKEYIWVRALFVALFCCEEEERSRSASFAPKNEEVATLGSVQVEHRVI